MKCENCIHYGVCVVNSYCHEPCGYYEEERPQWIPCSERLPEEHHTYLVTKLDTNPNGSTFTTFAYFYTEEKGWDIDGVIAWMPFPYPEPYKRGERNENRD